MSHKSGGVTFLLNFFIPGTGHVYASGGERWGLLAINIGCAIAGAFLILPWLGNLIVWVLAMVQSSSVTNEYNNRLIDSLDAEEDRARQLREQQRRDERKAKAAAAEREASEKAAAAERAAAQEAQRAVDAKRVSGADLAERFAKLATLVSAGVMAEAEADSERKKLVAARVGGWTEEDLAEFLGPFAVLVQSGGLKPEDTQVVKNLYASLKKSRPG